MLSLGLPPGGLLPRIRRASDHLDFPCIIAAAELSIGSRRCLVGPNISPSGCIHNTCVSTRGGRLSRALFSLSSKCRYIYSSALRGRRIMAGRINATPGPQSPSSFLMRRAACCAPLPSRLLRLIALPGRHSRTILTSSAGRRARLRRTLGWVFRQPPICLIAANFGGFIKGLLQVLIGLMRSLGAELGGYWPPGRLVLSQFVSGSMHVRTSDCRGSARICHG